MKKILSYLCVSVMIVWMAACARQGYPSGGPKDVTPPQVGEVQPLSGSVNFDKSEFYIPFDEYVVVKDAENNILVSPPMSKKPEYLTKGRGILVRLRDSLQENATYLFQFKGAIADLNEGNVLESFEYAFSTGEYIDSMSLQGRVLDALTQKPVEEVLTVMLYDKGELWDSTIANEMPSYVTRCNKLGDFKFNNIRGGNYRLVAIVDADKNMKYGATEAIAFCDTLVSAVVMPRTQADTTAQDSVKKKPVVAVMDSSKLITLQLSKAEHIPQRLLKSEFLKRGRIQLVSQVPMVAPCLSNADSLVMVLNAKRDTLNIWTRNEQCDSVEFIMSDASGIQDTIKLKYRERKKGKTTNFAKTALMSSMVKSTHPYFDTMKVSFTNPIHTIAEAETLVEVMLLKDSSVHQCGLTLDSNRMVGYVDFVPLQGEKYRVKIPQNRVYDIYGHAADSLVFTTEVTKADLYGNIVIRLSGATTPVILQLLNEKGELVRSQTLMGDGEAKYQHLVAGKYNLRAIIDANGNGRWDAGDYWQRLQPEKVVYLKKVLELRANWDMDESFAL